MLRNDAQQIVAREPRERVSHEALLNLQLALARRRVNSNVMQLFVSKEGFRDAVCGCVIAGILLVAACHKGYAPNVSSPVHVSLCKLYGNPTAYDGKLVTITATVTQLPGGKYLYPGPSRECDYSFIKLDTHSVQHSLLTELESSAASSTVRKEFDLEVTGTFDSRYSEAWDAFRYRIVSIEIKPQSPIRIGKALGAG